MTAPAHAPPTTPTPEPPTGPRRRRASWIRRVLLNGALFAVGGSIALIGLRVFELVSPPAPVAPVAPPVDSAAALPRHAPVVVFGVPLPAPVIPRPPIRVPRPKSPLLPLSPMERARAGGSVRVNVTAYCLQGITRRDHQVRRGIVAADPRYFPLGRYIDLSIGFGYHGRYLVDDTGKDIQGLRIDVWTESCTEARRFGRRFGSAKLVPR